MQFDIKIFQMDKERIREAPAAQLSRVLVGRGSFGFILDNGHSNSNFEYLHIIINYNV